MIKAYINGKVYTVNKNRDWAEAVVTDGPRIVYVGDNKGAEEFIDGKDAEIRDLAGKLLLPGFIDGHCHPVMGAFFKSGILLNGLFTLDEMLEEISGYISEHPDKEYYSGKGFEEVWFVENETMPDRFMLDRVCPDKPIFLYGTSGHVCWCNSAALAKAGITAETPDPLPGRSFFARDEEGNPTGYLLETMAASMVTSRIEVIDTDEINSALTEISEDYAACGVTSICDMGGFGGMTDYMRSGLIEIVQNKGLKQRFNGCGVMVNSIGEIDEGIAVTKDLNSKINNDMCRFTFVKMFQDGTLEDMTAAISEPYLITGTAPETFFSDDELIEAGLKAAEAGFDINIHCIGDMASHGLVKMTEAIREAGHDETRIVNSHSTYLFKGDAEKFGKLGILANTTFVWHAAFEAAAGVLSPELPPMYEMKTVLNKGGRIGAGSDYPVDDFGSEPVKGLQMGCTRKMYRDDIYPGTFELEPESEKLSMDDVITAYTMSNAYQMRMEDKIGSIEVGKYADMVILDRNIFELPVEEVYMTKVCETIMNGETTYND